MKRAHRAAAQGGRTSPPGAIREKKKREKRKDERPPSHSQSNRGLQSVLISLRISLSCGSDGGLFVSSLFFDEGGRRRAGKSARADGGGRAQSPPRPSRRTPPTPRARRKESVRSLVSLKKQPRPTTASRSLLRLCKRGGNIQVDSKNEPTLTFFPLYTERSDGWRYSSHEGGRCTSMPATCTWRLGSKATRRM